MSKALDHAQSLIFLVVALVFHQAPDFDIRFLGIGAHRNFFFHSAAIPVTLYLLGWWALRRLPASLARDRLAHWSNLVICAAATGNAVHLLIDGTLQRGNAVKFPLIGTLVDGTSLDDSLWLVTNGLLSVVVANRTWRPEFRAAFRETWGLIASLVDRVVGSRAHRSPAVAPRTPTIDDAKRSVERIKTLASRPELRDGSRDARAATEKLAEKIERGVLHIGVVGRISSGKTALARQLLGEPDPSFSSPIGGTTRTVVEREWRSNLRLVDTPGLEEVDGRSVETLAREAAKHSDIIIFVTTGDLTHSEFRVLQNLAHRGKGVVLAINKTDALRTRDHEALRAAIGARVAAFMPRERVVLVQAQPIEIDVIQRTGDGGEQAETRVLPPRLEDLQTQILEVAARQGESLLARNAFDWAGELADRLSERLTEIKRETAEDVVLKHAIVSAGGAAAIPSWAADVAINSMIQAKMIREVAAIFEMEWSLERATQIAREMTFAAGKLGLAELATAAGTDLIALVPVAGAATGAVIQGATAAYATYVAGQSFIDFCAAGERWPAGSARNTLEAKRIGISRKELLALIVKKKPDLFAMEEKG